MYSIKQESEHRSPEAKLSFFRLAASVLLLLASGITGLIAIVVTIYIFSGTLPSHGGMIAVVVLFAAAAYLCFRFAVQVYQISKNQEQQEPPPSSIKLWLNAVVWSTVSVLMLFLMLSSMGDNKKGLDFATVLFVIFGAAAVQSVIRLNRWRRLHKTLPTEAEPKPEKPVNGLRLGLSFVLSMMLSLLTIFLLSIVFDGWGGGERTSKDLVVNAFFIILSGIAAVSAWKSWQHFLKMFQRYADKQKKW